MGWIRERVICRLIGLADSSELNEIALAVLRRYDDLFAEEEVVFLSLPKHDREERKRIIQSILSVEEC